MAKLESDYKRALKKRIQERIPGSIVFYVDPALSFQGAPDLMIIYEDCWAMLEVKRSASAPKRPNQEYHVNRLDEMSFAAFIYPENEEEVLDAVERSFEARGASFIS